MRTLFSAFAGIAAVVLCLVGVPGLWLDQYVVSEDGFVEMAAPLGSNDAFQQQLAEATTQTVLEEAAFGNEMADFVRPMVQQAAQNLTDHSGYQEAWEQTLRSSHQLTFADNGGGAQAEMGTITLDIAPIVTLAAQEAADAVGTDIPEPESVPIEVGGSGQQTEVEMVQNYANLSVPFAVAGAVAFVLAMVIARRRSTTLVLIGLGVAISAGLWKLGAEYAVRQLEASQSANELAALFKSYFADVAESGFNEWILAGAGAGAVMILIGLIARIFAGSRT